MKKSVFWMWVLSALCAGSAYAQETTVVSDTIIGETEILPQPTDDKYRVVTNRFWDNWFVLGDIGGHAFVGDYGSTGKFKGLLSPDFNVGVGKWFTPGIGMKVQFGMSNSRGYTQEPTHFLDGEQITNGDGEAYWETKNKWWDLNVNAMFNLSRLFCGYEGRESDKLMNQFIASVGLGAVHHRGIEAKRNEWSGHFEIQYSRFFNAAKRVSLDVKARAVAYQTNFDGVDFKSNGERSTWFDSNIGLSVGVTYYFKDRHWDRCQPCGQPTYYINNTYITPAEECPEYGTMVFYVFFPNNYSGRDDAPVVADAPVNAIDYLASGIFTQKKFDDTDAVASRLETGSKLSSLSTSDIPTEEAGEAAVIEGVARGYEMSDAPISLSMDENSMESFKDKTGYYYAPMYNKRNTWYYRVDKETISQKLLSDDNYMEKNSYSLNAHDGLDIVKKNMNLPDDTELYSFADIYTAIEGANGFIAEAADTAAVARIKEIFAKGRILSVVAEGLATSQDNYYGKDADKVGLERNKKLAYNRAYTVTKWLKGNDKFQFVADDDFALNSLSDPIATVDDKSTQGLAAKLNRCVKVKIRYVK